MGTRPGDQVGRDCCRRSGRRAWNSLAAAWVVAAVVVAAVRVASLVVVTAVEIEYRDASGNSSPDDEVELSR